MRWLLKEMEDGVTLIGLLHVTPKTHLRVIKLLQTLILDLRPAQESFIRRYNSKNARDQTAQLGPLVF